MPLSRRDFLKLSSLLPLLPLAGRLGAHTARRASSIISAPAGSRPNILIFLFDALTARNLALYGYPRQNTPNLQRLAQRAVVYHAHHSAGNFTTPSTASLFTGVYPWTHRAINLNSPVGPRVRDQNLFDLLSGQYNLFAFSQNILADMLVYQLLDTVKDGSHPRHPALDSFALVGKPFYNHLFPNDAVNGLNSYDNFLFKREEAHGSLFLSIPDDVDLMIRLQLATRQWASAYPVGLPRLANTDVYFAFQPMIDGVLGWLDNLKAPTLAYFHFMPPHEPYRPTQTFIGRFHDGWTPAPKKPHRLGSNISDQRLNDRRQDYDEFVANLDAEFGRILDHLEQTGLLQNSYVIFTSDHGEMFERGVHGHSTPLLYEPGIHVPLLISTPGQTSRQDITIPTSNVDMLPSLLQIAGLAVPGNLPGRPLPGLPGGDDSERSLFTVEAKKNPAYQPLTKLTVSLIRGRYKLIYYLGYRDYDDRYEMYDLENDPEELENIVKTHPLSKELQTELQQQRQQADQPYQPQSPR